jgi:PAS domain-containing protein
MTWYRNPNVIRYAAIGFLAGFIFPVAGFLFECSLLSLPCSLSSFLLIQRTQPLIWIIELAPLVLGGMAGLFGRQRGFLSVISQAKKEWETTFDAFSDPVFITDHEGRIVRCNHAVLDRLNSTYDKTLGRRLDDVLSEGQGQDALLPNLLPSERLWFKRIYDAAFCPIYLEDAAQANICILHDITERKKTVHWESP